MAIPSFTGSLFTQDVPSLPGSIQQVQPTDPNESLQRHIEMAKTTPFQFEDVRQSFLQDFNPQSMEELAFADIGLTEISRTAGYAAVDKMPYEADPDLFPVDDDDWERMTTLRQLNINADETQYQVDDLELENFQKQRMESLRTASRDNPLFDDSGLTPHDIAQVDSLPDQNQRSLGSWKDQIFEGEVSDTELLTAYESGRLNLKEYQTLTKILDKVRQDPEKVQVVSSLLNSSGLGTTDPMIDIIRNNLLEADNPIQALSTNLNMIKEAKREQSKIAYQSSQFLKVPVQKLTTVHIDEGKHAVRNSFASGNLDYKTALQELQKINGVNV